MCYIIYNLTEDKKLNILSIGDAISYNDNLNKKAYNYNSQFVNKDYRIIDLLNVLKYNEEIKKEDKTISIHQLLKKSDILIISIGLNDIYYKLNDNTKEIYTYINNMLDNYKEILNEINNYDYKKVYVLGYYNITNKNNDIFTYINYKLEKLSNTYGYSYIDLNKILYNNPKYLVKKNNYYLNNEGYQQIYNLIVENLKKTWYNIKCIYYYDLY